MSVVQRSFDDSDLETIHRVYEAAWARLTNRNPVRSTEEERLRQKNLRKRLFVIAKPGAVDFDNLYAEVVAIYEKPNKRSIRAWRSAN